MPYYGSIRSAINSVMDFMVPTQKTNLALLLSAILIKRSLCLSELARAYPRSKNRRTPAPKHCLLHRQ